MADQNVVALTGNAGTDAEIKYFDNGKQKARFRLAVKGWKENSTTWVLVEFWGKTAEIAADYIKKGTKVAVSGRLEPLHEYTGRNGEAKAMIIIAGTELTLLGGKRDDQGDHGDEAPAPRQQQATQRRAPAQQPADDGEIPF